MLLACAPLFGQQYTISTLAGDGAAGAFLDNPASVTVDSTGDVYVGDWSGFIRKIWVRDGGTTIVAGTGILGYGGDGGQATNAKIGRSINIALDASGNIHIADGDNNRIRRVDISTGIIDTVAGTGVTTDSGDGGPAVNAGVSGPTGITADHAGNLYFSSWTRVRKLIASTGIIETVAGQNFTGFSGDGGTAIGAMFWDPVPSVVNSAGDIYIADFENSRIRLVTASTGIVTTIAGSGPCPLGVAPAMSVTVCHGGFSGDGGPATKATLNYPNAVALDEDGNFYIADTINHRIRRVDASTGFIHTIAGTGVSGFSGDGGPALAAEITFPAGIAVGRWGRVYFADESNNRIRMLTPVAPQPYLFRPRPHP